MSVRKFLPLLLCLLSAVDSFSLRTPIRASSLHPGQRARIGLTPAQVFTLRGGDQEEEVIDFDKPVVQPKKNTLLCVLDATFITGALTAFGRFYSSSLESSPVLTKSVTVRSM